MSNTPNPKKKRKSTFVRWIKEQERLVGIYRDLDGTVHTAKGFMHADDYERTRAQAPAILPRHCDLPLLPRAANA
jgi:hypothetical protein